jgi:hypothetical protein
MRLLPATVLLSLALPACHSPSILAHGCLTVTDRATCTVPVQLSAPLQSRGTIDAALTGEYTCTVLVEGTSLPSPVEVVNVEVAVLDPVTQSAITQFSVPTSASLSPSTPLGAASVILIDHNTLAVLGQKVVATGRVQEVVSRFSMVGRTADGAEVGAPPIDLPIDIRMFSSCVSPVGQACFGDQAKPVVDCRLGIDEPAGTSCQAIAGMLGPCRTLECNKDPMTGKSNLTSARCPVHVPADDSCCDP